MKLETQVCSVEFARRLKELGVNQDSAFYWIEWKTGDVVLHFGKYWKYATDGKYYSALTVAELGEMLPFSGWRATHTFRYKKPILLESGESALWKCREGTDEFPEIVYAITEADARAKMLIRLIETGAVKIGEINK
jgi:hypothetical protein